jgi:hypothetical protein
MCVCLFVCLCISVAIYLFCGELSHEYTWCVGSKIVSLLLLLLLLLILFFLVPGYTFHLFCAGVLLRTRSYLRKVLVSAGRDPNTPLEYDEVVALLTTLNCSQDPDCPFIMKTISVRCCGPLVIRCFLS